MWSLQSVLLSKRILSRRKTVTSIPLDSGEFDLTVKGTKETKQGQHTDLAGVMRAINAGEY